MEHLQIIYESPASTIYSSLSAGNQPCVIKVGYITRRYSPEPHDLHKEAQIIARLSHPHIISSLGHGRHETRPELYCIWLPYVSRSLADILSSPLLSPHAPPWSYLPLREGGFEAIAKSLSWQTLSAVAYLHDKDIQVAHRDIKPSNILLTPSGCVKMIDFGVCYLAKEDNSNHLWPEPAGATYTQVCTGPYRPPELLFGASSYDAFAVDMWSLSATLAEFYTALRLEEDDDNEVEESDSETDEAEATDPQALRPFIVPSGVLLGTHSRWLRDSLFDASRGDIGLAWSIFQIRGTPNEENWPDFLDLPHARKLVFNNVSGVELHTQLPNLPTTPHGAQKPPTAITNTPENFPGEEMQAEPLDLLHRLMAYPPSRRLRAADALQHPWFSADTVLLPEDYPEDGRPGNATLVLNSVSLSSCLAQIWS